jgi:hypothetical protein
VTRNGAKDDGVLFGGAGRSVEVSAQDISNTKVMLKFLNLRILVLGIS